MQARGALKTRTTPLHASKGQVQSMGNPASTPYRCEQQLRTGKDLHGAAPMS